MQVPNFSIARLPKIEFGSGVSRQLPEVIASYGDRALLVLGAASFAESLAWAEMQVSLQEKHLSFEVIHLEHEPSPQWVDEAAAKFRAASMQVVVGIGGGSVLDAAKALAGLLAVSNSVMDYLEGVGPELPYAGKAIPFVAIPTTAGTGSEATKNAVLSQQGEGGFKKSFRHDSLVPLVALVDPDLLITCPPALIAANGMDAFTQLLESYLSTKANPLTDALAMTGIRAVRDSLLSWYQAEGDLAQHRANMAYAALLSGITLAQVGLGSVHGLAAPLGAFFPIPHGVACGTLVAECTRVNIQALQVRMPESDALWRYAHVGKVLANDMRLSQQHGLDALVSVLDQWTLDLKLPPLSNYGMSSADIPRVVANCRGSSMKTNPIVLTDAEIADALMSRL